MKNIEPTPVSYEIWETGEHNRFRNLLYITRHNNDILLALDNDEIWWFRPFKTERQVAPRTEILISEQTAGDIPTPDAHRISSVCYWGQKIEKPPSDMIDLKDPGQRLYGAFRIFKPDSSCLECHYPLFAAGGERGGLWCKNCKSSIGAKPPPVDLTPAKNTAKHAISPNLFTTEPTPYLETKIIELLVMLPNTTGRMSHYEFYKEYVINGRKMAGIARAKEGHEGWSYKTLKNRKRWITNYLRENLGMPIDLNKFRNASRNRSRKIVYTNPSVIERTYEGSRPQDDP